VFTSAVFWVHWRIARRAKHEELGTEGDRIRGPLTLASVIVFGLSCSFCSGLVGGLAVWTLDGYSSQFAEELRAVTPILADPAFAEVGSHERSDGHLSLSGVVSTETDLKRLRAQVARALGARRGEEATCTPQVRRVLDPPPGQ
jgi:hypothetical protein